SPRIRAELIKNLKLEKSDKKDIIGAIRELEINSLIVNDPDHSYISKRREVSEDELAIVTAKIE
ncbi:hypothetical protein BCR32DRAFT_196642, partial [Anaeromyces robustus]